MEEGTLPSWAMVCPTVISAVGGVPTRRTRQPPCTCGRQCAVRAPSPRARIDPPRGVGVLSGNPAAAGAQFARGKVPPPLVFSGRDELAVVARTFNEMVEARTSALKERERQLAEAQGIAHVGSWELDLATNRVTWSDELYRICGVPVGSPAGYTEFLALVHPEDRPRAERVTGQVLADGRPAAFEWRVVRPDGELRHIFSRNVAVRNGGGTVVRIAGTCIDITDRKAAEENQQTLLREL